MANQQSAPQTASWDEALDVDGNPTVPLEEQLFLLPNDWDPSSTTDGRGELIEFPSEPGNTDGGDPIDDEPADYGWNEKLGRWIAMPPFM